jgi:hypothetical protein
LWQRPKRLGPLRLVLNGGLAFHEAELRFLLLFWKKKNTTKPIKARFAVLEETPLAWDGIVPEALSLTSVFFLEEY